MQAFVGVGLHLASFAALRFAAAAETLNLCSKTLFQELQRFTMVLRPVQTNWGTHMRKLLIVAGAVTSISAFPVVVSAATATDPNTATVTTTQDDDDDFPWGLLGLLGLAGLLGRKRDDRDNRVRRD
jgi:MYXO-CTERM domain-containing protein